MKKKSVTKDGDIKNESPAHYDRRVSRLGMYNKGNPEIADQGKIYNAEMFMQSEKKIKPEELAESASEYFNLAQSQAFSGKTNKGYDCDIYDMVTLPGFCAHAGISRNQFKQYHRLPKYQNICSYILTLIDAKLTPQALGNIINGKAWEYVMKNHDSGNYQDKMEIQNIHEYITPKIKFTAHDNQLEEGKSSFFDSYNKEQVIMDAEVVENKGELEDKGSDDNE